MSDSETMTELKSALAGAMETASVELGPDDLTQTSAISVLPPGLSPLENNSTAMPVMFDLMKQGDHCYIVKRDTGAEYILHGVACNAVDE